MTATKSLQVREEIDTLIEVGEQYMMVKTYFFAPSWLQAETSRHLMPLKALNRTRNISLKRLTA